MLIIKTTQTIAIYVCQRQSNHHFKESAEPEYAATVYKSIESAPMNSAHVDKSSTSDQIHDPVMKTVFENVGPNDGFLSSIKRSPVLLPLSKISVI